MINYITTEDMDLNPPSNRAIELTRAATRYINRGWSVIPLRFKQPTICSWREFQEHLPSLRDANFWFHPNRANVTGIGVITGSVSNLVVVDCDTPADAEFWLSNFPCSSGIVKTGREGIHVYYEMPRGVELRNRVGVLGRKIDIRAEGGYVAAPPSIHEVGRTYQWMVSEPSVNHPLPVFNPEWITSIQQQNESALPAANGIRHVVGYVMKIRAISGSCGHNATFRAACKLRDAGLSRNEAYQVLAKWNLTNAEPPWSETELIHKVKSAYGIKYG